MSVVPYQKRTIHHRQQYTLDIGGGGLGATAHDAGIDLPQNQDGIGEGRSDGAVHPSKVPPFSDRSCPVYADWWCPQDNRVEFYVGEIGMGAISQSNTRTLYGLENSNKCSVRELSIEIKTRSLFLTASLKFRFGNSQRYPASKRLRRPCYKPRLSCPK